MTGSANQSRASLWLSALAVALPLTAWLLHSAAGRQDDPLLGPQPSEPESSGRSTSLVASLDRPSEPSRSAAAENTPEVRLRFVEAETDRSVSQASIVFHRRVGGLLHREEEPCNELGRWSGSPSPDAPFYLSSPRHVDVDLRPFLSLQEGEHTVGLQAVAERRQRLEVVDPEGSPIVGARVYLGPASEVVTDGSGTASFLAGGGTDAMPSIRYAGTVAATGYQPRDFHALDERGEGLRIWNAGLPGEQSRIVLDGLPEKP